VTDGDPLDRDVVLARPLSPRACAALAGVSYPAILRAIRGGHLRAFHPPRTTLHRIAPADFVTGCTGIRSRWAPRPAATSQSRRRTAGPPQRGSVEALSAIQREAA
jgi:hypothetical protein